MMRMTQAVTARRSGSRQVRLDGPAASAAASSWPASSRAWVRVFTGDLSTVSVRRGTFTTGCYTLRARRINVLSAVSSTVVPSARPSRLKTSRSHSASGFDARLRRKRLT